MKMDLRLFYKYARKDAVECSINKHFQNMKKFVRKSFNQREKHLTLQFIERQMLKAFNHNR